MPLKYEPIAIPVAKGIDVSTRARLVEPTALLEAKNSRLTDGGSEKRRGHRGRRVRGAKPLPPGVDLPVYSGPNIPEDWLWGWGHLVSPDRDADNSTLLETSPHPDASILYGATYRDDEALFWNGFQLFSRLPGQPEGSAMTSINAVMPTCRAQPAAKSPRAQDQPDVADNGIIKVFAWLDVADSDVYYTVLDSQTDTTIVPPTALGFVAPVQVRCINVGGWVHMLTVENDTETLVCKSIHEAAPTELTTRSMGQCPLYFDVCKVDEDEFLVARNEGNKTIAFVWYAQDAQPSDHPAYSYDHTFTVVDDIKTLAIAVHPVTGNFAVVFRSYDGASLTQRVYAQSLDDATGIAIHGPFHLATTTLSAMRIALAPKYVLSTAGEELWEAYWDDYVSGTSTGSVTMARWTQDSIVTRTRYNVFLASQAFRVGDRTFVWACTKSTYQSQWYLLDESLKPVGHLDFIQANAQDQNTFPFTPSMNWRLEGPIKDVLNYHGALGYKVRVQVTTPETANTNIPVVYAEPSIRFLELDFLPNLMAAQAGRCTYFAGNQVWVYDGVELVEAGFHLAPEVATPGVS